MEKYGVVTEVDDLMKKASAHKHKDRCPDCGCELEKDANVPKCPKHGTRPFEGMFTDGRHVVDISPRKK